MNVTGIRHPGVPAPRPQDRAAVPEGPRREPEPAARRAAEPSPATAAGSAELRGALSEAEQRFFEELYPGAVQELRTSPTYARTGLQPDQRTGTMIDRKG